VQHITWALFITSCGQQHAYGNVHMLSNDEQEAHTTASKDAQRAAELSQVGAGFSSLSWHPTLERRMTQVPAAGQRLPAHLHSLLLPLSLLLC
jgi:hypothetical protein